MKIKPDFIDRNDGYGKDVVRYFEEVDEDGYFYEIYVIIVNKRAAIVVTDDGVSVDFITGETVHTNIVPKRLFPGCKSLSWKQLDKIMKVIENTNLEGKVYTRHDMDVLHQEWKNE